MADLEDPWEGTVATAVRDAQWLAAGTQGLPGLYASLSGRVENKHGDTLFQAGARFFLFELKGGPSLLSTEWTDTRVVVVDGKKERIPNPKPLHQASVKKALDWNPGGSFRFIKSAERELLLSLRGHHFVYWDNRSLSPFDMMSGLLVQPYVAATFAVLANAGPMSSEVQSGVAKSVSHNLARYFRFRKTAISTLGHPTSESATAIPLSYLFEGRAFFQRQYGKGDFPVHHVGLTADELEEYVAGLVKVYGDRQDRMKAIVLSDTGFYRSTETMGELARVFEPHPALVQPTPGPDNQPEAEPTSVAERSLPPRPRPTSKPKSTKGS